MLRLSESKDCLQALPSVATSTQLTANSQQPTANSQQPNFLDRGLLLHDLFSRIRTANDAPTAIATMVRDGLIGASEQHEVERIVHRALAHPQAADWFSGRYTLFNECSILYRSAEGIVTRLRPDRVMQDGESFIVVDFKFARERDEHHDQVCGYIDKLRHMGHSQVEGYIWYVYENRVTPAKRLQK